MLKDDLIKYKIDNPTDKVIKDKKLLEGINEYPLDLPIKQKVSAIILGYTNVPLCSCGNHLKWSSKRKEQLKHGTVFGGWLEFCSRDCMRKSASTIEKRKQTNLQRYGTTSWAKSEQAKEVLSKPWSEEKKQEFKEKCKLTSLEKHGVEHYSQTQEYLDKRTKTTLEQTGGRFTNHFQDVDRIKKANIEKYGVEYYTQTEEGRNKLSLNNGMKRPEIARKSSINKRMNSNRNQELLLLLIENNPDNIKSFIVNTMEEQGFQFRQQLSNYLDISYSYLNNIMRSNGLRDMYLNHGTGSSYKENDVYEYVKSLGVNVINSDRTVLSGMELDVYCPDQKLGIEFDGMRYHSVLGGKDRNYHLNKTQLLEEQGGQLLHIFESEWDNPVKRTIWKSIIKSKLGLIDNKIYARKCVLSQIDSKTAKEFFNNNHLSGFIPAKEHYGLYYDNQLVSAISIGQSRFNSSETEIYRFASLLNYQVTGALGKFLKNIKYENLVTFADRRISGINSSYGKFFAKRKELPPTWWGMEVGVYEPKHRLNYTKKQLQTLIPNYDETKSAIDNMLMNGFDMIYDCGNWKFFN